MSIPVFFTDKMTGRANGMASVVSCKNQNSSFRGKFLSREKNISWRGIRVIRVKVTEKRGKNPRETGLCSS